MAIRNYKFLRNRSTKRLTSLPICQISVFPGNFLYMEDCEFEGNDYDVDYHQDREPTYVCGGDRPYNVVDTTGMHNNRVVQKLAANTLAWATHPTHYPWV